MLQGTEDEVIDLRHGKRLYELAKLKSQPLWAEGHNHQVSRQWCRQLLCAWRCATQRA